MAYVTAPFIGFVTTFLPIMPLVIILDLIGVLTILFVDRLDPRSFVFWLMIIIVMPVVGFALYFALGNHFYSDRRFNKKRIEDSEFEDPPVCMEGNNDVSFIPDRDALLNNLMKDISCARKSIWFEVPSVKTADVWEKILPVLERMAGSGLDVRIMSASYGFGRTYGINRLCRAGGRFCTFNNRLYDLFLRRYRNRNLRMMMVIDKEIVYSGYGSFLRVEGPVVSNYVRRFILDWAHGSGEPRMHVDVCPMDDNVYMFSDGRDTDDPGRSLKDIVDIVVSARKTLYIAVPYLTPDDDLCNTIKLASYSGADVRILLPGRTWYKPRRWNSLSAAYPLMEAGVRVYFADEYSNRRLIVADGRYCMTGSCVISTSSLERDLNLSTVTCSEKSCSDAESLFMKELDSAVECTAGEYEKRTLWDRCCIAASRFFMYMN